MIGINQRDLRTFEVDQTRALRVAAEIPDGIVKIAESGIKTVSDAEPLKLAGFDGVLIGESLVKSENPKNLITELRNL
jgi:indole-3-glycerol phosphate synthase